MLTPPHIRAVHIWDPAYYAARGYTLKRLVFIYETLCDLPVEIIKGDTLAQLANLGAQKICVPDTADIGINLLCTAISERLDVERQKAPGFAAISDEYDFKRFFKYWHKAKKTAFLKHGGLAQGRLL